MLAPHISLLVHTSKSDDEVAHERKKKSTRARKTLKPKRGSVKKAGRVLIFFTHFPPETPFLKAAGRLSVLPLPLSVSPPRLTHCLRWPPFTLFSLPTSPAQILDFFLLPFWTFTYQFTQNSHLLAANAAICLDAFECNRKIPVIIRFTGLHQLLYTFASKMSSYFEVQRHFLLPKRCFVK